MTERIAIESSASDGNPLEKDAYSWVQNLDHRGTHRKVIRAVKHGLKTLAERALNVQIIRTPSNARSKFSTEYHHQSYNNPWSHGRDVADYLISRGLRPGHHLLDFGCGCIRAGIWLIGYLDEGHYFGVDGHLRSLQAAVDYEIPLHSLEHKRPRFLHSKTFEIGHFRKRFDVILAKAVFDHLAEEQIDSALRNITSALAPAGKLVLSPRLPLDRAIFKAKFGLELVHEEKRPSKFSDTETPWFEFKPPAI